MSDRLNPIFVLRTQRLCASLRRYGTLLIVAYLFVLLCSWRYIQIHQVHPQETTGPLTGFMIVVFMLVGFFSCILSVIQMDLLPKRYIDEDLIHFTALTDRQVLFGYVYVGMFYSGLVCFCGVLVHILILPGLGWSGLFHLLYFISFFLISQMLNLFCASFFAGVRKRSEFIGMGMSMYLTFFILFGSLLSPFFSPDDFFEAMVENPVAYWTSVLTYVSLVSALAYVLILLNLRRTLPLPLKMLRAIFLYSLLAASIYIVWSLIGRWEV